MSLDVKLAGRWLQLQTWIDEDGGLLLLSDGQRQVAQLVFETEPGAEHVTDLCVDRDLRRQGVATYLWSYARSRCADLRHDHLGAMTDDGLAFAGAVGGQHMDARAVVPA